MEAYKPRLGGPLSADLGRPSGQAWFHGCAAHAVRRASNQDPVVALMLSCQHLEMLNNFE